METGEAAPEISKLLLLAKTFHVTADWLLSEDEPEPEAHESEHSETAMGKESDHHANWVESIPGVIGKLVRRYGWLVGVYTALAGLGFTAIGAMARILTRSMFSSNPFDSDSGLDAFDTIGIGSGTAWYDEAGNVISSPFESQVSSLATNNPVAIMGTVIMVFGILMIIAGVILAVCLKKRSNAAKA